MPAPGAAPAEALRRLRNVNHEQRFRDLPTLAAVELDAILPQLGDDVAALTEYLAVCEGLAAWVQAAAVADRLRQLLPGARFEVSLAKALFEQGRIADALTHLLAADVYMPGRPEIRLYIVECEGRLGRYADAADRLRRWLAHREDARLRRALAQVEALLPVTAPVQPATTPGDVETAFIEARRLAGAGEHHAARVLLESVLPLIREDAPRLTACAQIAASFRAWPLLESVQGELCRIDPSAGHTAALATALFNQRRYEQALALYREADAMRPGDEFVRVNLLASLMQLGRYEDVVDTTRDWLRTSQDSRWFQALALNLMYLERVEEVGPVLAEAMRRFPDNRYLRLIAGKHWLLARDYARGFDYYRDRWAKVPEFDPVLGINCPAWDGKPFAGTLLVGAEEAVGEELVASSIYGALEAMGQDALIEAEPRLLRILQRSCPRLAFVPRAEKALARALGAGREFRKVAATDLFHLLGMPARAPGTPGWLHADPAKVQFWKERQRARWGGRPVVGVSWRSTRPDVNVGFDKDIDLAAMTPLLSSPGVVFVSVQHGETQGDLARLREQTGITVHADHGFDPLQDLESLFAFIASLDLVISTSNTNVHVAGSLGTPCWLLMRPRQPLMWYWGYAGAQTPWYPSVEMFRSPPGTLVASGIEDVVLQASRRLAGLTRRD